jgi:hypothetical protein
MITKSRIPTSRAAASKVSAGVVTRKPSIIFIRNG